MALNDNELPAEEPSSVTMQLFTTVQLSVALALVQIVHGQAAEWGTFLQFVFIVLPLTIFAHRTMRRYWMERCHQYVPVL